MGLISRVSSRTYRKKHEIMDDEISEVVQLDVAARCICSHVTNDPGGSETSKFYVGTCSTHQRNSIQIVEYDDYENVISRDEIRLQSKDTSVSKPIWHVSHHENHLAILQNNEIQVYNSESKNFEFKISEIESPVYHQISETELTVLGKDSLSVLDLETKKIKYSTQLESQIDKRFERGEIKTNPHDDSQIYHISGKKLNLYDTRENGTTTPKNTASPSVSVTTKYRIRSFDVNPNRPDWVSVACDDRSITTFDIRDSRRYALETAHTHWIWSLRFNPFHDRLILSSGSDNRAVSYNQFQTCSDNIKKTKWSLNDTTSYDDLSQISGGVSDKSSISGKHSENSEDDEYGIKVNSITDGVVASYDDFEDSVYAAAWSHSDAWIWAVVSYDGKLMLNHVPKGIKYSILL